MRQRLQWRTLPVAIGLAVLVAAGSAEWSYARGRGGGFGRGGFSREGPAAGGSFASRSGGMAGREGGMAGREGGMAAAGRGQANRMAYGQQSQASRQQEMNSLQGNREQAAKSLQNNAQQYRGGYPYAGYPAWDAGAGVAAAATGAAIGAAAASAGGAAAAGAGYAASQPCGAPEVVSVGGTTYYRCGSAWYAEAFGPSGPTFIAVRPPGY